MPGPYRAEAQKEKRRLIAADIGVTWQETNGARHSCTVRAFNISETSVWVMSTDRLDVGSWVQAHADDLGFSRAAQVRSCEPQGSKYVITLDFRSQLFLRAERMSLAFHDRHRSGMIIYLINSQGDAPAGLIFQPRSRR